ncbi:hypothetical protein HD554DRAFT_1250578 [Boletus coccyginus]|nr:hypothetical protein HD554DRAFT_1250578 [Boletus coccyginus]
MDDTGLCELISALPERCIALMEDIDAAFHHGLSRESTHAPSAQTSKDPEQHPDLQHGGPPVPSGNRVSLSGLLNALDGIGTQEGRVLFATTNKYSSQKHRLVSLFTFSTPFSVIHFMLSHLPPLALILFFSCRYYRDDRYPDYAGARRDYGISGR